MIFAAEDLPDVPRQPDRPAPALRGFLPLPEIETQEEAVEIDGFRLLPLGELGRTLEIHPKALAGLAWDSNPLLADDGSADDVQQRLSLGVEARLQGRDRWSAGADATLRLQRYRETEGRDTTGSEARMQARHSGDAAWQGLQAGWSRTAEPIASQPDQLERQTIDAAASAAGEGRASRWSLRAAWMRLDYLEDSPWFDRSARDRRRWSTQGAWHLLGARESMLGVAAEIASTRHPQPSPANDGRAATLQAHWRHALGGRSAVDLRAGATRHSFDDHSAGDPGNGDRVLWAPAASTSLYWGWEERSRLILLAATDLEEGMVATTNAARRDTLEGRLRLRLQDRLDLVGAAWSTWRTDSAPRSDGVRERTRDVFVRLGLDYRLRDGLGLRLWLARHDHAAEASDGYRRALAALELAAAL